MLLKVSWMAFLLVLVVFLFIFRLPFNLFLVSLVKSFWTAFDILLIIFGAIFFHETLKGRGIIDGICKYLGSLSKDVRVQVIILSWFFMCFLEGIAGFGTPAAVIAPLLVGLGLTPLTAVVLTLLGNSTPTIFGAVGTPIRVGFAGLQTANVGFYGSLFNLPGFLVPVFILLILTVLQKRDKKFFFEKFWFAFFSGVAFVVPSIVFSLLGNEFPTIFASILGLMLILVFSKNLSIKGPSIQYVYPYILLISILVIGKVIGFNLNPGFAFLATSIVIGFSFKNLKVALKGSLVPFLVIFAMSSTVGMLVIWGGDFSKILTTPLLPYITPFLGALGSFLTGSATISNIMFGKILSEASALSGFNTAKIMALQLVGATAGGMIALGDMIAVQAVVGIKNQEGNILKATIFPCLIYITLVGILGLVFI